MAKENVKPQQNKRTRTATYTIKMEGETMRLAWSVVTGTAGKIPFKAHKKGSLWMVIKASW